MSRFIGLDLHKEYIHGCEWSPVDPRERHFRFPNTQEAWEQFLAELDGSCQVALEVTGGAFEIYDRLAEVAGQVVVANPLEMKRLGSGRHTDRNDAARLAKMLALGVLPGVWVPPASIRELRNLLRFRERLVCTRRRFINQAKAVLRRHGHTLPCRRDPRRIPAQTLASLPAGDRFIVESAHRQLVHLDQEIAWVETELARRTQDESMVQLLLTIPGVGLTAAISVFAFLGDPHRFRSAKQVARYAGLDPSVHQSGTTDFRGHISKNGCAQLRSVLVEAAHVVARYDDGPLGRFYRSKRARLGHKRSIIALARKLLIVCWKILQRGEPYRAAKPHMTNRKQRLIRRIAARPLLGEEPAESCTSVTDDAPSHRTRLKTRTRVPA